MNLTITQRSLLERVINAAETGSPEGDYAAISIYADGPNDIRQITYGRAQTTEYGNLRKLVEMYVQENGIYSNALRPYADKVGSIALTGDELFKSLLKSAGKKDPIMGKVQDKFFEEVYFKPAMKWADNNGFTTALSALVIYDSQIHSGGILWLLRQRFTENPPSLGGNEKKWISEYVRVRHNWLKNHHRKAVQKSAYRTRAYQEQILNDNWNLTITPINMNGINVNP